MSHQKEKEDDFYCRYHVFSKGSGFTEFEFTQDGRMKYANKAMGEAIRRQCNVSPSIIAQIREMVSDSRILQAIDTKWPAIEPVVGGQEMEIRIGNEHISFTCATINSMADIDRFYRKENVDLTLNDDPLGLKSFYYLGQDLRALAMALVKIHYTIKPR